MIDLKPYYQVKLTLLTYKASFSSNPPKTEDEKYAYDIVEKAYWINEKNRLFREDFAIFFARSSLFLF